MMNLLLSPSGRITPSQYMTGMVVIGVVSALVALLGIYVPALEIVATLVSLVLFYAFFALGIKRSHDAGKSGWMSITHFLLLMLISMIALYVVGLLFGRSLGDLLGLAVASGADPAVEGRANALPGAVAQLITYPVTAYLVNMLNPHDPTPNQYGNPVAIETTFD